MSVSLTPQPMSKLAQGPLHPPEGRMTTTSKTMLVPVPQPGGTEDHRAQVCPQVVLGLMMVASQGPSSLSPEAQQPLPSLYRPPGQTLTTQQRAPHCTEQQDR